MSPGMAECGKCKGSGNCTVCKGEGKEHGVLFDADCIHCRPKGSGNCSNCGGSGRA